MFQIIGTVILVAQALRGQVKVDQSVTLNEKGHLDISWKLSFGILAIIGGLLTQAFSLLDSPLCG